MSSPLHSCPRLMLPAAFYLFSFSCTHKRTYRDKQAHTHFHLLVTRCQREQVEGTLPHAGPSVCCCRFPYLARYTATNAARLREANTLQQSQDDKYNLGEEGSQPGHQTKNDCKAAEQLTSLLASANIFKICDKLNVHFRP